MLSAVQQIAALLRQPAARVRFCSCRPPRPLRRWIEAGGRSIMVRAGVEMCVCVIGVFVGRSGIKLSGKPCAKESTSYCDSIKRATFVLHIRGDTSTPKNHRYSISFCLIPLLGHLCLFLSFVSLPMCPCIPLHPSTPILNHLNLLAPLCQI